MIAGLIAAATLAETLSAGRQIQLTLKLSSRGVQIDGLYLDRTLSVGHRYEEEIAWRALANHPALLEEEVRRIERKLAEHWRKDGALEREAKIG